MSQFSEARKDNIQSNKKTTLDENALQDKKIAIIGGTNGIGRALAHTLVAKSAEVTVVGRTFRDSGIPRLNFIQADLSQLKQARRVAQELPGETLEAIIMTTGIFPGKQRLESPEGIEVDLAVSYLSRFVIVRQMAEHLGSKRISKNIKPKVFIMGTPGSNQQANFDDLNSEREYKLMTAHVNTVIGNEALVLDSAVRYPHVNFYGLNPGIIKTNIRSTVLGEGSFRHKAIEWLIGVLSQSAEEYCEKIAPLLVSPEIEDYSGAMFNRHGDPIHASRSLTQGAELKKIIEASERLISRVLGNNQGYDELEGEKR